MEFMMELLRIHDGVHDGVHDGAQKIPPRQCLK